MSVQLHYYLIEIDKNTSMSIIGGPLKAGEHGTVVITKPDADPIFEVAAEKVTEIDREKWAKLVLEEIRRNQKPK